MFCLAVIIGILLAVQIAKLLIGKFTVGSLSKKAVFITGCDTGFGHLFALKCATTGIPTFAGCFTEAGKQELTEKAKNLVGPLWTLNLDVRNDESVRKAAEQVRHEVEQRGIGKNHLFPIRFQSLKVD